MENRASIEGRSVCELGAGAALPSLVSLKLGCCFCCIIDFPSASVLNNIQRNVQRNIDIDSSSGGGSRCVVLPHVWGERPCDDLLAHMPFDCIVISECLWKRDALLSSLSALLVNGGDVCLLRFQPPPAGLRERGYAVRREGAAGGHRQAHRRREPHVERQKSGRLRLRSAEAGLIVIHIIISILKQLNKLTISQ